IDVDRGNLADLAVQGAVLPLPEPVVAEAGVPDHDLVAVGRHEVLEAGGVTHPVPVPLGPPLDLHRVQHVLRHDAQVGALPCMYVDPHDVVRVVLGRGPYRQHAASVTVGGRRYIRGRWTRCLRPRHAGSRWPPRASPTRGPAARPTAGTCAGCLAGPGCCRWIRSTCSSAPITCRSTAGSGPTRQPCWTPLRTAGRASCSSTGAPRRPCCPCAYTPA